MTAELEPDCGCCEINDYWAEEDYGPCEVCGHSPEEHTP